MELTASTVEAEAETYREVQPLWAVERDRIETLPETFAEGEFVWRDAEWIVRWYGRRFLGDFPEEDRRAMESGFRDNDDGALRRALSDAVGADDPRGKLAALTGLEGVDVRVASAFLMFMHPEEYLVVGEREWRALAEAGELPGPPPDSIDPGDYLTFLEASRAVADRCECTAWELYRAIWSLTAR